MKVRKGFVSNSSSTSFYIDAKKFSKSNVEGSINRLLDVLNFSHGQDYGSYSSICEINETDNIEKIKYKIRMHYSYDNLIVEENDDLEKEKWPKEIIVVDSIDDNSIPYIIQEFLENELGARRQHWG